MKGFVVVLVLCFVASCGGNIPKDQSVIEGAVSVTHDRFKGFTSVSTPLYLSSSGISDTFPVKLKYRATFDGRDLLFVQLYVVKSGMDWGFYQSAHGEDGHRFEFVRIDSDVDASSGVVTTAEHFALSIPEGYLAKMQNRDWSIKVYGKRAEGVFVVPSHLTRAFAEKLGCVKRGEC